MLQDRNKIGGDAWKRQNHEVTGKYYRKGTASDSLEKHDGKDKNYESPGKCYRTGTESELIQEHDGKRQKS